VRRLASGDAFPFLTQNERVIAANMSVHALVWKLGFLAGHVSRAAAQVAAPIYAVTLVAAVAAAARRLDEPTAEPRLWLAALFLGALVSPFAPNPYAPFALLWLLTLLVPVAQHDRRKMALLAATWLASAVMVYALPLRAGPTLVALSLIGQLLGFLVAGWVLVAAAAQRAELVVGDAVPMRA
jgi:hypothetical protein